MANNDPVAFAVIGVTRAEYESRGIEAVRDALLRAGDEIANKLDRAGSLRHQHVIVQTVYGDIGLLFADDQAIYAPEDAP